MALGWGSAIGKIFSFIPGGKEHRRNKIAKIKRQMDEIVQKNHNGSSMRQYKLLADKLYKAEQKAINAS